MNIRKSSFIVIFSVFSVMIFWGCHRKPSTQQQASKCSKIILDYQNKSLNRIPNYSSIRFIPLEISETALLGEIRKIVVSKNRYFILDAFSAEAVFIYDWNGALINVIHTKGKGPQEYLFTNDIAYDPYNEELVIVDSQQKKVLKYNKDGDFISEVFFNITLGSIGFINENTYVFITKENQVPVLKTVRHNGEKELIIHQLVFELNLSNFYYFPRYKDQQFYFENLKDTIWTLKKDRKEPHLIIDFNDRAINQTEIKELREWANMNKWIPFLPKHKSGQINLYMETDKYIQFFCRNLGNLTLVLIAKENMKVLNIANGGDHKKNPLSEVIWSVQTVDDYGRFIGHINADRYLGLIQQDKFNELKTKGIISVEEKGFKNQANVRLESNPILVVHELASINY